MVYAASAFGKPVWEQMKAELLESSVIHADETVVQVLNEPGKKSEKGFPDVGVLQWKAGRTFQHPVRISATRNGDHAVRFLGDYRGYLVCDGYDGYNKLKNAVRCGCFAHVRRKFVDALPSDPELFSTSQAAKGVEYCNRVYGLERQFAGYPPEERMEKRQAELKPLLEDFFLGRGEPPLVRRRGRLPRAGFWLAQTSCATGRNPPVFRRRQQTGQSYRVPDIREEIFGAVPGIAGRAH